MAERVGIIPPRACTPASALGARARRAADIVFPLPAEGSSPEAHNLYSLFFDSDTPPMFKSFLRRRPRPARS